MWAVIGAALLAAVGTASWTFLVSSGWLAGQIRQTLVARLEESLNRPVALGGVDGDLLRGIDLRDLVIAESGGFSHGVIFSADRIHVALDLSALVRHPQDLIQTVVGVQVVNPRLTVSRSASGAWNLASLLGRQQATPLGPAFQGRVIVQNGLVGYSDGWESTATPFVSRFSGVTGTIEFRAGHEIAFDLAARGADGEQAAFRGEYLASDGIYDMDVTAKNVDVRRWATYIVHLRQVQWAGGRFDGRMHLLLTPAGDGITLDYSATVRLHDAAAEYVPRRVMLRSVSGDLILGNGRLATPGLSLVANGSAVQIRGDVGYPSAGGTQLDLLVVSPRLDLGLMRTLFFPGAHLGLAGQASGNVWISGPLSAPYLDGDITAAAGRLNQEAFADLRMRFQYGAGMLALHQLSARIGGGQVAGDGVLGVSAGDGSYTFAATTSDLDIAALPRLGLPALGDLSGRVSGEIAGMQMDGRTRVMAAMTMPSGSVRRLAFEDLRTLFWDDGGAVALDFLGVRKGATDVYASGDISAAGGLDLALSGYGVPLGDALGWAGLGTTGNSTLSLAGQANVDGRLSGTVRAPVLSGDVTAWDGHLGPVPFALATGPLAIGPRDVRTSGFALVNGPTSYQIRGGVAFQPMAAEALSIDAQGVSVAPLARAFAPGADVTGTVSGHVAATGPFAHPVVSGDVSLLDGSVGGQPVDGMTARFTGNGRQIQIETATARINRSRLEVSGSVDLSGPLNLRLAADQVRLSDIRSIGALGFVPGGTVSLSGAVTGTLRDPDLSGTLTSPDLSIHGQTFQASGVVDYRHGTLTVSPVELAQGGARYGVTGWLRGGARPTADLTFSVEHGQIATVVAAAAVKPFVSVGGTIDGTVGLQGPLDDPAAHLVLSMHDGEVGGVPIGTGDADLTLTHGTVDIQKLALHPAQGQLAAQGRVELHGTSAVEVSGQNLDVNVLRPLFHTDQPLAGALNFTIQWSGPTNNPTAGLSMEALNAGLPGATADRIASLAYYKDGTITIETGTIEKGTHKLLVAGTVPVIPGGFALAPDGPLNLQVSLEDADLSLLTLLTPEIQDGSGTVAGQVAIGGTVAAPEMSGTVQSHGGRFRFAPVTTPLENVSADIAFSQSEVLVRDLSATVGAGTMQLQGTIGIKNLRPDVVALNLAARGVTFTMPGLYTGGIDGTLSLTGAASRPTLGGTVTLSHGNVALAGGGAPTSARGIPVALDVSVNLGDAVAYAQGPVRADLAGGLHVGGTISDPAVSGAIRSLTGTISLLGTPYTVTEGQLVFSEASGLNAQITAHAQAMYGDTRVFLDILGVLPSPTVTWSSDPPMSQDKILALVAGTSGASGSPASLLSQVVLGSITQTLQQALRLDAFTISYDTQNPLTLQIGKYLFRNVYLSLAEVIGRSSTTTTLPSIGSLTPLNPSGQPYTVLGIQYYLSPTVSLTYNVNSLGDSGVFLLARFPF
ncbi:MAG TPA: translocation/assembly module TamB domain-containing protein [bacterium]|nr:translocation/assembly module TamB domain-containing protein [bacterium]